MAEQMRTSFGDKSTQKASALITQTKDFLNNPRNIINYELLSRTSYLLSTLKEERNLRAQVSPRRIARGLKGAVTCNWSRLNFKGPEQ